MLVKYKKRKITLGKFKVVSWLGKYSGLMFRSSKTSILIFSFKRDVNMAIHSYFVFFKFLAVWVDEKGNVLETKIILPFTTVIRPKRPFRKLIEIPFNSENNKLIRFFVGKRKI